MSTLIFFGNYIKVCPVLVEQELLTLLGHPSSPQVFSGVRVTQSLVLCVCFVVCPFVLFLLAIVLSVLLRLMDSDYSFGIIHSLPTIYIFFHLKRTLDYINLIQHNIFGSGRVSCLSGTNQINNDIITGCKCVVCFQCGLLLMFN